MVALKNATKFLSFLGSYNIFMAPLCAVWIVDYAFGHMGNLHVPSLYDGRKGALHWFWDGINWLGVFAWVGGMIMGIPGLVGQYEPEKVSDAAINMYNMGWLLTFFTGIVYLVLLLAKRLKIYPDGFETVPAKWELLHGK
ncbi:allantoin transport like protein [Zalerion maritima]|uniref:Allantoin transport like protein n=1 Tax=Zalerion maritima TaxID=339359 RepID=A0AAD5RZC3_9PEZI|nr:allantoin transport like protein [Zalerion maritima]